MNVPSLVATQLLFPGSAYPQGLALLDEPEVADELSDSARVVSLRLKTGSASQLRLVPVIGDKGSPRRQIVQSIARANQKEAVEFAGDPGPFVGIRRSAYARITWTQ